MNRIREAFPIPGKYRRRLASALVRPFVARTEDPISYLDEEWDTLVILDACRFDSFHEQNPFDARVRKVHSNATHTSEFLAKNFGGQHPEIVYTTASPQVANCRGQFAHVKHVWRTHWDEDHRTVLPHDVTDAALEAHRTYPDKRHVVHYMQPHYPFIGPTGDLLGPHATFTGGLRERTYANIWDQLCAGKVDVNDVKKAYEENLSVVLPEIDRLINDIDDLVVLTSDHGNLFRERVSWLPVRICGHPPRLPHPKLTAVPWVEFPSGSRRNIARAAETESPESGNYTERLAELGYLE